MTCHNIKHQTGNILNIYTGRIIPVVFVVITALIVVTPINTFNTLIKVHAQACSNISDEDDRLECLKKEQDKKEAEYQSTQKKLEELINTKNQINTKISTLAGQLSVTQEEINELQSSIDKTKAQLEVINNNLKDRKDKLAQKIDLRNKIIRNYVKQTTLTPLETFLMGLSKSSGSVLGAATTNSEINLTGFERITFSYGLNKSATEEVVKLIGGLNSEIGSFEQDKQTAEDLKNELEVNQNKLTALKNDLANKKALAQSELNNVNSQANATQSKLNNLEKEIEELSSKQKEILKEKGGDESGSVGDYEPPGGGAPDAPFSPAFAVFSYGAYTHYNGMSQYGAKGRADKGQDYKEILKFYYKVSTTKKSDFPSKIKVQGYGEIDFQYYLYGLAEMPTNWPIEALKAQAVAGRTYAYKANKPICTTQSCQVFSKSKADQVKSGKYPTWKKAVDETKNEILNGAATAQYSSTTGGYINNVGWDTKGKWPGDAYEKLAKSPWFYKSWYTKSYNSSDSCGRGHPWMSQKEMADILNSWVVWDKGSNDDEAHITPITTKCWGGDPYSMDEMAEKADKYGTKYSKVTDVDVEISNSGYTSKVTFTTDKGKVTLSGQTFKTVFNLRAPGYVSVKSRLFDIEKE